MGKMKGDRNDQLSDIYDRLQELKNDLAEIVNGLKGDRNDEDCYGK